MNLYDSDWYLRIRHFSLSTRKGRCKAQKYHRWTKSTNNFQKLTSSNSYAIRSSMNTGTTSLSLTTVCLEPRTGPGRVTFCHENDQCMMNPEVYVECILHIQNILAANAHMSPFTQKHMVFLETAKLNRIHTIQREAREPVDCVNQEKFQSTLLVIFFLIHLYFSPLSHEQHHHYSCEFPNTQYTSFKI